jgi:hypothetical protein
MKKILVLLLLVSFASISFAQESKKNDLALLNLKGNVKYIEESTYNQNENKEVNRTYKLKKYNKDGNLEYELTKGLEMFPGFSKELWKFAYKYDNKGKKTLCYRTQGDSYGIDKYVYDVKGNKIEYNSYDNSDKLVCTRKYKYDEKENLIDSRLYFGDFLNDGRIYEYDKKGVLKKETCLGITLEGHYLLYKYDEKGNKIESYFYNKKNSIENKTTYKYDEFGNVVMENNFKGSNTPDSKTIYNYKYDINYNWTRQEYKSSGKEKTETKIIERKIVYYGDKDENNYPSWDDINYKADEIKTEGIKVDYNF